MYAPAEKPFGQGGRYSKVFCLCIWSFPQHKSLTGNERLPSSQMNIGETSEQLKALQHRNIACGASTLPSVLESKRTPPMNGKISRSPSHTRSSHQLSGFPARHAIGLLPLKLVRTRMCAQLEPFAFVVKGETGLPSRSKHCCKYG